MGWWRIYSKSKMAVEKEAVMGRSHKQQLGIPEPTGAHEEARPVGAILHDLGKNGGRVAVVDVIG